MKHLLTILCTLGLLTAVHSYAQCCPGQAPAWNAGWQETTETTKLAAAAAKAGAEEKTTEAKAAVADAVASCGQGKCGAKAKCSGDADCENCAAKKAKGDCCGKCDGDKAKCSGDADCGHCAAKKAEGDCCGTCDGDKAKCSAKQARHGHRHGAKAGHSPAGEIETAGLKTLLASDEDVIVLDARGGRYDDGRRIPGAKALPAGSNPAAIAKTVGDKDAKIVTYCANLKCPASSKLASQLRKLGYTNVTEYPEGIDGWQKAGNDVQKAK